ncbi:RGG repeats nuclear RNA binding protein B [Bienertia sinuspersici]
MMAYLGVFSLHQQMTLKEYEKVLEEKRKALLALKAEERKLVSKKKNDDEVFIKLSVSINEFLKPAESDRHYRPEKEIEGEGEAMVEDMP